MAVKIGILIATYNRPDSLESVLHAILESSLLPHLVVVSDASDASMAQSVKDAVNKFEGRLDIRLVRSSRGSLCHQRNLGKSLLASEDLYAIQVLDDDTRPTQNYLESLVAVLQNHRDVVGVSGISHDPPVTETRFTFLKKMLFSIVGLDGFKPGSVTLAGVGIAPRKATEALAYPEWIFGCSMWRANYFFSAEYRGDLVGSCLFEDVDFSIRAAKSGKLAVNSHAILNHDLSEIERPNLALYAYRFSRNRFFVISNLEFKLLAFWFYTISVATLAFVYGFKGCITSVEVPRKENFAASIATLKGYFDALLGKEPR